MKTRSMKRVFTVWFCFACAGAVAEAAESLPYENESTNAVDWTTLTGWSGNATNSTVDGLALFDAGGRTLTLEVDGTPTDLLFSLRGYSNEVGMAPASFTVEQSGGGSVWNSTLVADISDESLSEGIHTFGPYALESSTRFIRFTYADQFAYDIGLNNVAVGGPAELRVVFTDRDEGFIVAQGAADEIITAAVVNGGGFWFGFPALETDAWESDNSGTFKPDGNRDIYYINTSVTGDFSATANGFTDNTEELLIAGTIQFTVASAYAIDVQASTHGSAVAHVNGHAATNAPEGALVTILPVPDAGYATDSIQLNGLDVDGTTFVMPGTASVVSVSFRQKQPGEPTLILSQVYEGSGENKWIELFNPQPETVNLDAAGYRLGLWQNAARENWKTGGVPAITIALTGSIAPGAAYLVSHANAVVPTYAVADVTSSGLVFNGDDSVVLYTGTEYDFANVVDAFGLLTNTAANCSFVRVDTVEFGVNTDFDSNDWVKVAYTIVDAAVENVPDRLGWHSLAQNQPTNPPTLTNLTHSVSGLVFEISTNYSEYTVYGASGWDELEPSGWAESSIVDQCTIELAGNNRRITVPTTFGRKQMIWLSIPGTN